MTHDDFPNSKPIIFQSDPAFQLDYNPKTFEITNCKPAKMVADLYTTPHSHIYGKLFAKSPELYFACRRARSSNWTLMAILDKKMPGWRDFYTCERVYTHLCALLDDLESVA